MVTESLYRWSLPFRKFGKLSPRHVSQRSLLKLCEYLIIEEGWIVRPFDARVTALCADSGLIRQPAESKGTYGENVFAKAGYVQYKGASSFRSAMRTKTTTDRTVSVSSYLSRSKQEEHKVYTYFFLLNKLVLEMVDIEAAWAESWILFSSKKRSFYLSCSYVHTSHRVISVNCTIGREISERPGDLSRS